MRTIVNVVLLGVVLAALPLSAQRYGESVTVNVVEVPVFVERFGVPVTGLTRDDFELSIDGRAHPIEYFDVVDDGAAIPQDASPAIPDLRKRRLVVLLFDVASASSYALMRARASAVQYVAEGAPGDVYAVAMVGRSGVQFLVPFTTDRVAVQRAVGTLAPSAARDPFRVATLQTERTTWREMARGAEAGSGSFADAWGADFGRGFRTALAAVAPGGLQETIAQMEGIEAELADRSFTDSLTALAGRLAPLEGTKHVVLLSDRSGDSSAAFSWAGSLAAVTRLHRQFRSAGVILDAVDIGEITVPADSPLGTEPNGKAAVASVLTSHYLWMLALDTGGVVTSSLPQLRERNRYSYILGFRPPPSKEKSHSVRVHVKNQRLLTDVRYTKTYSLVKESTDDGLLLADTLLNDIPQNGVTLDVSVKETWFNVAIPGVELLANRSDEPLTLDAFLYVFDDQDRPVAWNQLKIAVDLERGREYLSANQYNIRQQFHLGPGRYTGKALVRMMGTDKVGFRRIEFVVPPS